VARDRRLADLSGTLDAAFEGMPTLQTILVPIDGSPPSVAALEHALTLAQDYGAEVMALHVATEEGTLTPVPDEEANRAMDAAIDDARIALGDDRLTFRICVGEPITEIVEAAADADLIVIGTHGRVGRIASILGSVAEGVVRNAPCPVLTVHDATGGYQSFSESRHHRPSIAEQARER
jgi:nucleotide-binding universal stress UspA family protein